MADDPSGHTRTPVDGAIEMVFAAGEQAWNVARLAAPVQAPAWRVWRYVRPAIILGVSQRARLPEVRERVAGDVDVLVRGAGGGAVLAWPGLVSLSVALPLRHPAVAAGIHAGYRWLGDLHLRALASLGVDATLVDPDALRRQPADPVRTALAWACFAGLSPWEVVAPDGRKLAGFAQKRGRHGVLLVAGTLVTPPDWGLLAAAMGVPDDAAALARCTVSATGLAGHLVDPGAFARELDAAVRPLLRDEPSPAPH